MLRSAVVVGSKNAGYAAPLTPSPRGINVSRTSPTWFSVLQVDKNERKEEEGQEGGGPRDDEHHADAHERARQRHPHVVELEGRTEACPATIRFSKNPNDKNPGEYLESRQTSCRSRRS